MAPGLTRKIAVLVDVSTPGELAASIVIRSRTVEQSDEFEHSCSVPIYGTCVPASVEHRQRRPLLQDSTPPGPLLGASFVGRRQPPPPDAWWGREGSHDLPCSAAGGLDRTSRVVKSFSASSLAPRSSLVLRPVFPVFPSASFPEKRPLDTRLPNASTLGTAGRCDRTGEGGLHAESLTRSCGPGQLGGLASADLARLRSGASNW